MLCLGVLAEPFIFHTSNQLLANLLHGCYGKDEEFVGTVTGLGRVCGAVGALTLGMMFEWLLPHRRWGLGMILAGGCIAGMGLVGTAAMVVTLQMLFQWVYPLIWCGNSVAIVETMGRERRSVALSLMTAIMQTGTLATGIVHRLLLGASVSVPHVFVLCGATGVLVGAILFSRRRRLAAVQC